jgi:hypothetical protein
MRWAGRIVGMILVLAAGSGLLAFALMRSSRPSPHPGLPGPQASKVNPSLRPDTTPGRSSIGATASPSAVASPPDVTEQNQAANPEQAASGAPVLYLKGSTLYSTYGWGGRTERIGRLPSANVFAAQGSSWLAYLAPGAPPRPDADFVPRPQLRVWDPASGTQFTVGPGVDALWNGPGTRVAYLRPAGDRKCEGETCSGRVEVVVLNPRSRESRVLVGPGNWVLLAWSGDGLLISDQSSPDHVIRVSPGGARRMLPVAPSQLWDASPDGRWLLIVQGGETEFVPLARGRVSGSPVKVPLGSGYVLADGAWSHDSTRVAAVALDQGDPSASKAVIFSPRDPKPHRLKRSRGATGGVLWAASDGAVVFSRTAGARDTLLQAEYCPVEAAGYRCRSVLSWFQGVLLLRVGYLAGSQ